jgi:hypothetical protein
MAQAVTDRLGGRRAGGMKSPVPNRRRPRGSGVTVKGTVATVTLVNSKEPMTLLDIHGIHITPQYASADQSFSHSGCCFRVSISARNCVIWGGLENVKLILILRGPVPDRAVSTASAISSGKRLASLMIPAVKPRRQEPTKSNHLRDTSRFLAFENIHSHKQ